MTDSANRMFETTLRINGDCIRQVLGRYPHAAAAFNDFITTMPDDADYPLGEELNISFSITVKVRK